MNNSEAIPIFLLILVTAIAAAWTFFGMKWWLEQKQKIANPWVQFGLGWVVVVLVIFAPMFFVMFSTDELVQEKNANIRGNINFFVLLGWLLPIAIYIVIYLIRTNRPKR